MIFKNALIIDDNENEIEKLKEFLVNRKIVVDFINPNDENLNKLSKGNLFDLIFLDLQYVTGTSDRSTADIAFDRLLNSLSIHNGPYILIIWSKQDGPIKNFFLERIKKWDSENLNKRKPLWITDFDKHKFLNLDDKEKSSFFELKFKSRIEQNDGSFVLMQKWEMLIKSALNKFINKINSIGIENDVSYLLNIFDSLAKEIWRDSNIYESDLVSTQNFFIAFSELFYSYIWDEIIYFSEKIFIKGTENADKDKEKLIKREMNTLLTVSKKSQNLTLPGAAYKISKENKINFFNNKNNKNINSDIFDLDIGVIKNLTNINLEYKENIDFLNKCLDENLIIPFYVDITKDCDFASSKMIKKISMGILISNEKDYLSKLKTKNLTIKKGVDQWKIQEIDYNNKSYIIYISPLFTYALLRDDVPDEKMYMFHFRKIYLTKIKAIITTYMLNPGTINLD